VRDDQNRPHKAVFFFFFFFFLVSLSFLFSFFFSPQPPSTRFLLEIEILQRSFGTEEKNEEGKTPKVQVTSIRNCCCLWRQSFHHGEDTLLAVPGGILRDPPSSPRHQGSSKESSISFLAASLANGLFSSSFPTFPRSTKIATILSSGPLLHSPTWSQRRSLWT